MAETRKDKRAPVSLKVRFKSATVDEFVEHYARDISRGGIFIKSKNPMAIGTLLKFEFQLKDESGLIHGVGRVVWKRDTEKSDEANPPGMGIKFIKMDPDSRALVQKIIEERGDEPGRFEAGEAGVSADGGDGAAAAQGEGGFFPSTSSPDEMPDPEDRTTVRHASEFLAEALSDADESAAAEAREGAEAARKRTEEIQRQREAQASGAPAPTGELAEATKGAGDGEPEKTEEPAEEAAEAKAAAETEPAAEPAAKQAAGDEEPAAEQNKA
ncbi:MAG: TIGR02266 family protein, partial [Polyangiales bacterium]